MFYPISDLSTEYLDLSYGRGGHGLSASSRTKRMRTSFKHHQLRTMKSYFAINHNPDAKDLKQLSQKTGLPKRVLQVCLFSIFVYYSGFITRPIGCAYEFVLGVKNNWDHANKSLDNPSLISPPGLVPERQSKVAPNDDEARGQKRGPGE